MTSELWRFLPIGYLFTIAIEIPILMMGLSPRHPLLRRLAAGFWLTACTYPIVVLLLPMMFASEPRWLYLLVAEIFAPIAECALFGLAFLDAKDLTERTSWRDFGIIIVANIASFAGGEILNAWNWFGLFR